MLIAAHAHQARRIQWVTLAQERYERRDSHWWLAHVERIYLFLESTNRIGLVSLVSAQPIWCWLYSVEIEFVTSLTDEVFFT